MGGVWREERKALLKKLAKKRVDQLNSEKQEPADRSSSSQIYGKRGGRFSYRTSKNGNFIENIINWPLF